MKNQNLDCVTRLQPGIINQEIFERELMICKQLHREGSCNWGKCENCGVVPLLYKLHKGELLENPEEIKKVKEMVFL